MSAYRKKPVEVDAWRWLFTTEQEPDPSWVTDAMFTWPEIGGIAFEPEHVDGPRICIATLDAVAIALPGDWIIRGVAGELYPCKPEIFDETYESAEDCACCGGDDDGGHEHWCCGGEHPNCARRADG